MIDKVVIKKTILRRREILGEKAALLSCPFEQDCKICHSLFPKFKKVNERYSRLDYIPTKYRHPCYFYSPKYVKQRIKKLILD